ncbi:glycosyltransferase family 2 protein [Scleroderma citrinum Foug A]|uniref:Glycosyltransferase family 2 protein n=1 Tax=Scleroderma citrinum Foug A TaxID=1036808 RepID=A0A0C3E2P8_9AGAM|nr:glycosyltransferase family 2 protein [Scleroderma citrinum Foug A]
MIIPAYNETNHLLETTLTHLNSSVSNSSRTYEILIVDDGSKDDTSAFALKLARQYAQSDIRVITLDNNLGKGGAVRHGMLHGRGHQLLMVDADGASRFEDLEQLWANMDEIAPQNEAAVAIGSRAHLVKTEAVVKSIAVAPP